MAAHPHPVTGASLSARARTVIDRWIAKYPPDRKRAAVITALTVVQEENGGQLTPELIAVVADYLDMPYVAVMEVATFYSLFDLNPVGQYKIYVCTSISCMLRGSDRIVAHLKRRLGVEFGGTTADGKYTLKETACLAACGGAPACMIGRTYYENLTPEKIDRLLDKLE